tara:strand:+ start:246 stop:536 length:291 start_codon:yes stop_codon:yes gene_type:complete
MTFKEYYVKYLTLHRNKHNRRLHVVGNLTTLIFVLWAIYNHNWIALLLAPFIIYPFAWAGHLFFEKNKPAAWTDPIRAKLSDWLMIWHIITGRIPW